MKICLVDYRYATIGDTISSLAVEKTLSDNGHFVFHYLQKPEKFDAVVLGGGGLIFAPKDTYSNILYADKLLDLALDNRFFVIGSGYNGWANDGNGLLYDWRRVLDKAEIVSVRDKWSIGEFESVFGCKVDNRFQHYPDPAFLYEFDCSKKVEKRVAVSICSFYGYNEEACWKYYQPFLLYLAESDYEILWFPLSLEDEKNYRERYIPCYGGSMVFGRDKIYEILYMLSTCNLHITTRLHGLITSVMAKVPLLHLAGELPKVKAQVKEIGLDKYQHIFDFGTVENPVDVMEYILWAGEDIKNKFDNVYEKARNKARHHFNRFE